MATLAQKAREYKEEIMDGIAWVAIWKEGRSWKMTSFYLTDDNKFETEEDAADAMAIWEEDSNAILINEYYCAHMGEGDLKDIMAGIRMFYEEGMNRLFDSEPFTAMIEA